MKKKNELLLAKIDESRRPANVWSCLNLLLARASTERVYAQMSADHHEYKTLLFVDDDTEASSAEFIANAQQPSDLTRQTTASNSHDQLISSSEQPLPDLVCLPDSDRDAVMGGWTSEDSLFTAF
jgi:hypothetical protein